jgi:hypothetical protein
MLTSYLVFLAALALLWGAYFLWRRRVDAEVAEGARAERERLARQEPELLEGMDEAAFARVYARVQTPRFPAYALGALTAFLIGTPVFLGVMAGVLTLLDRAGMTAQPGEAARGLYFSEGGVATVARQVDLDALAYILQDWAGFAYYLGLLFFWVLIAYVFMSRYHRRTPGLLREEVLRSR